jgi:light-regulated signal transduction histidine kinase (bacteriophytochrome)
MALDQRDLEKCEREQLHLSGSIQGHGTLLAVDPKGVIQYAAANVAEFLGGVAEDWLGTPLPQELGGISLPRVAPRERRAMVFVAPRTGQRLDVVAHRNPDDLTVIELTPAAAANAAGPLPVLPAPEALPDQAALQRAEFSLVERIADLTGFPRVMYYRFREDGDGEVVAEARRSDIYGSYLGLRFPASDVPRIARALYVNNPWRMIPDAAAAPVPILGRTATPPDLSYSDLRSVSPVHQAYLANMGVSASLSFSIAHHDDLLALVAAHHHEHCLLPIALLDHCAALVRAHRTALLSLRAHETMQTIDGLTHRFSVLLPLVHSVTSLKSHWSEMAALLCEEFRADGAHLQFGDLHLEWGTNGGSAGLAVLEAWFAKQRGDFVATSDSLIRSVAAAPLTDLAGALGLRLSLAKNSELRLYLTRREYIHEVAWGGNPEKPVEFSQGGTEVSPRRSFEKWVEQRLGYCRGWTRIDHLRAFKLREFLRSQLQAAAAQ